MKTIFAILDYRYCSKVSLGIEQNAYFALNSGGYPAPMEPKVKISFLAQI